MAFDGGLCSLCRKCRPRAAAKSPISNPLHASPCISLHLHASPCNIQSSPCISFVLANLSLSGVLSRVPSRWLSCASAMRVHVRVVVWSWYGLPLRAAHDAQQRAPSLRGQRAGALTCAYRRPPRISRNLRSRHESQGISRELRPPSQSGRRLGPLRSPSAGPMESARSTPTPRSAAIVPK